MKKGVALLLVVFIVFFLSLFVIGFSYLASTDFQIATNDKLSTKALYVAEAGVEWAIYQLREDKNFGGVFNNTFPEDEDSMYGGMVINVGGNDRVIRSIGLVESSFRRELWVGVTLSGGTAPFNAAITTWKEM